jgi:hypothetical protein
MQLTPFDHMVGDGNQRRRHGEAGDAAISAYPSAQASEDATTTIPIVFHIFVTGRG